MMTFLFYSLCQVQECCMGSLSHGISQVTVNCLHMLVDRLRGECSRRLNAVARCNEWYQDLWYQDLWYQDLLQWAAHLVRVVVVNVL